MLKYHFTKKLLTTAALLEELSIKISELDFWKTEWRKKFYKESRSLLPYKDWVKENDPCWQMGLRIIGKSALWDPTMFLDWVVENKLKNLPIELRDKKIVLFVTRNSSEKRK